MILTGFDSVISFTQFISSSYNEQLELVLHVTVIVYSPTLIPVVRCCCRTGRTQCKQKQEYYQQFNVHIAFKLVSFIVVSYAALYFILFSPWFKNGNR